MIAHVALTLVCTPSLSEQQQCDALPSDGSCSNPLVQHVSAAMQAAHSRTCVQHRLSAIPCNGVAPCQAKPMCGGPLLDGSILLSPGQYCLAARAAIGCASCDCSEAVNGTKSNT
jgi:hypothetical protein